MNQVTIYHNPRCSKSRQSLQILQQKDVDIQEIRYLENPPTLEELDALCEAMNVEPQQIIRTGEALFKELGLSKNDQRPRNEWLEIMVKNPKLIERPIVKLGNKVVIGRPPEAVETLFETLFFKGDT